MKMLFTQVINSCQNNCFSIHPFNSNIQNRRKTTKMPVLLGSRRPNFNSEFLQKIKIRSHSPYCEWLTLLRIVCSCKRRVNSLQHLFSFFSLLPASSFVLYGYQRLPIDFDFLEQNIERTLALPYAILPYIIIMVIQKHRNTQTAGCTALFELIIKVCAVVMVFQLFFNIVPF